MLVSGAGGSGIGAYFLAEAVIVSSPHPAHRLRALNLPYVPGYRGVFNREQSLGGACLYVEPNLNTCTLEVKDFGIISVDGDCTVLA
jgi:hypothetical protein